MKQLDTTKILLHTDRSESHPSLNYYVPIWAIIYLILLILFFYKIFALVM